MGPEVRNRGPAPEVCICRSHALWADPEEGSCSFPAVASVYASVVSPVLSQSPFLSSMVRFLNTIPTHTGFDGREAGGLLRLDLES